MSGMCPECGYFYDRLGQHWSKSCTPEVSPKIKDVITGLVMGDGSIENRNGTPFLVVAMKKDSLPYLKYLSEGFGPLSADVGEYEDMARFRTHSHPVFESWAKWYQTGHKKFPDDVELSPLIAKHWYVGDGGVVPQARQIRFYTRNERDRIDWVAGLFEDKGFNTRISDYEGSSARVVVKDGDGALDWMGESLPSFEHKWNIS